MKILELTLTNFLPILAGIGKESITIDLRDSDKLINVFIGKIGSGKTYILSHLQPFATVGTLDVRNNDDPIVPEKDGKKIIIYQKGNHEYTITHLYSWTGKTHTKKSYIEKDGIELNENGNSSSFKDIIQVEFGIDQSFLRLIRLGNNVVNFINMKATERKAYIASLLEDSAIYLMLYKNWTSELRTLNTKASILMNKMNSFSNKSIEELEDDLEQLQDALKEHNEKLESKTQKKYALQAENKSYIGDMTYKELQEYQASLSSEISKLKEKYLSITNKLDSFKEYPDINTISKEIGRLDGKISSREESSVLIENEYNEVISQLNALKEKKAISYHEGHIETLKETYQELIDKDALYKRQLSGFKCNYTSTFLTTFMEDLNGMNMLINELLQYDSDIVKTLYHSDSSIISYARKKEEILGYKKLSLQKMINNLSFAETYQPVDKLYFPPFCPTKSCPYHTTHPSTLQKKNPEKNDIQTKISSYQEEIQSIDVELYKYSEYPSVYSKIGSIKSYWKKASPVLSEIGALNAKDLLQIITTVQYQSWYNYDKIIDTLDMLEKRDRYFKLTDEIKSIKNELNELSILDIESITKEIGTLESKSVELSDKLEQNEKDMITTKEELKKYNQIYLDLSEKSIWEQDLVNTKSNIESKEKELSTLEENQRKISDNFTIIQRIDLEIQEVSQKINAITERMDSIKTKLNDIKYTNKELDKVTLEQKYMTYMVDAVSSKKGIPLIMIQLFLDSCRDIVNELIFDICEEDIELLPFKINDTEFKIPYMVNGQKIDDISKASQGQTSIVSTAMSFALVRQTGSTDYNVPLLDEMDAPLHKSDKQRFIAILLKHLKAIGSEQCFVITHDDNTFDGYPVQVIMTTDENVNKEKYTDVIRL